MEIQIERRANLTCKLFMNRYTTNKSIAGKEILNGCLICPFEFSFAFGNQFHAFSSGLSRLFLTAMITSQVPLIG